MFYYLAFQRKKFADSLPKKAGGRLLTQLISNFPKYRWVLNALYSSIFKLQEMKKKRKKKCKQTNSGFNNYHRISSWNSQIKRNLKTTVLLRELNLRDYPSRNTNWIFSLYCKIEYTENIIKSDHSAMFLWPQSTTYYFHKIINLSV